MTSPTIPRPADGEGGWADVQHTDPFFSLPTPNRADGEALAEAIAELPMVKPLVWYEGWGGSNEDIPSWTGKNPLHLHVGFSFAGRLHNGKRIETHAEAPAEWVEEAKAKCEADYTASVRVALTPRPAEPAQAAQDWRPPADREDGYRCLGWTEDGWVGVTWLQTSNPPRWFTDWYPERDDEPTAFAPMPPAIIAAAQEGRE